MSGRDRRIAVLGAGAWGTALACSLASRLEVGLWVRDPVQAQALRRERRNARYLPEIELPASLRICAELADAVDRAQLALAATPVAGLRDLLVRLRAHGCRVPLVWLCKGFEQGTGLMPNQIVEEVLPAGSGERGGRLPHGALSGPSFALEVAQGLPCALTLASRDADFAREAAGLLHGGTLRIYYSADLVGVEVAGAVKNVMAIAAGISDGLKLGQNARAALITRGLAEITRLGVALGGSAETFMGLAGAGDLILTATGDLSRNRRVGLELARGGRLEDILKALGHVAEGVYSAIEVAKLAARHGIDMPVTDAVCAVLERRLSPREAVGLLLARDPRREI
jgi:glycerol-3-phosphate dehydrogenase (NAD(P)+)